MFEGLKQIHNYERTKIVRRMRLDLNKGQFLNYGFKF